MSKIVFITGGTGLVGGALVKHFLAKGFRVVTTHKGSKSDVYDDLISTSADGMLLTIRTNFLDENSLDLIMETLRVRSIKPNFLISNARDKSTLQVGENNIVSRDNFSNEFYIQVIFPYLLANRIMNECEKSLESIINVGSQYGVSAVPPSIRVLEGATPIHYAVSKAAVVHLTKEMAMLWAKDNVRVNCISLGGIDNGGTSELTDCYKNLSPIGRMLNLDEVLEAFDFLLCDGAKAITGHNLLIDGGWTVV